MKQIVAVDIDDVLAPSAVNLVAFSNKRWGTSLTIDDYDEHWGSMWKLGYDETKRRAVEWHASGEIGKYQPDEHACSVLESLKDQYAFVIITSRRSITAPETLEWIEYFYRGVFQEVRFAGFYDNKHGHTLTKAELCQDVGANYLIDDQLKHCLAASEVGITALLYGDYKWNCLEEPLPQGVKRVKDWPAVG